MTGTSEAPQDVAALPLEPESPIVQAWNAWRRSPEGADGSRAEAFVAGWQAAANPTVVLGLLDQNDRLRKTLRTITDHAEKHGWKGLHHPLAAARAALRGSGAEEAARNE